MTATNPRGPGDPVFCEKCGESYRETNVLPGPDVGFCPTCFEEVMNR